MGKVFVAFTEEEQQMLTRIYFDEDPGEALEFVLRHVIPKMAKEMPCIAGALSGNGK